MNETGRSLKSLWPFFFFFWTEWRKKRSKTWVWYWRCRRVAHHVIFEGTNYANSFSANRDHINPAQPRQKENRMSWNEQNVSWTDFWLWFWGAVGVGRRGGRAQSDSKRCTTTSTSARELIGGVGLRAARGPRSILEWEQTAEGRGAISHPPACRRETHRCISSKCWEFSDVLQAARTSPY